MPTVGSVSCSLVGTGYMEYLRSRFLGSAAGVCINSVSSIGTRAIVEMGGHYRCRNTHWLCGDVGGGEHTAGGVCFISSAIYIRTHARENFDTGRCPWSMEYFMAAHFSGTLKSLGI